MMDRDLAIAIVDDLKKSDGPQLTVLEVLAMTKVFSDGHEVYSIQKGNNTFLARTRSGRERPARVTTKVVCW